VFLRYNAFNEHEIVLQNFTKTTTRTHTEVTTMEGQSTTQTRLIQFLNDELAVPTAAIALALRHHQEQGATLLPMVLWQYGLITLEQLDRIFDWLEMEAA
jgi:hypothetical protein